MAKIDCRPTVTAQLTIRLSEEEAAALEAIASYETDEFLKYFYEHMGRSYLQPYENGLRSLFNSIRNDDVGIRAFLLKAEKARELFSMAQTKEKE